jgi:hypothetical protein
MLFERDLAFHIGDPPFLVAPGGSCVRLGAQPA